MHSNVVVSDEFEKSNLDFFHTTKDYYERTSRKPGASYTTDVATTQKKETKRRHLLDRLGVVRYQLIETEVMMGIEKRWEPQDEKYLETLKYSQTRQYHRALDHLQKLVVQRLFELQKLNLAGTGVYLDQS